MQKIYIGSDHGGFVLKTSIIQQLKRNALEYEDLGTHDSASCDYPIFAHAVAQAVLENTNSLGILICGTGLGMSMAAGKIQGIRAAVCTNTYMARMARAHNNANILCLGERVIGLGLAEEIVTAFLSTDFEGERHLRRISLFE